MGLEFSTALLGGAILLLAAALLTWRSSAQSRQLPAFLESSHWWMPRVVAHTIYLVSPPPTPTVVANVKRFGGTYQLGTILGNFAVVAGPEFLRWAFRADAPLKMALPNTWRLVLGEHNISFKSGSDHTKLRTTLATAFTPPALVASMPMIQRVTCGFLADLAKSTAGGAVDAYMPVKKFTLDIASAIMLGVMPHEDPRLGTLLSDFTTWLAGMGTLVPINLPFTPVGKSLRARARIIATLRLFLEERRGGVADAAAEPAKLDTLGRLMSARIADGALTDPEILDALLGFIFAGHDTSTTTICSAFYVLTKQATPDAVTRLREEVTAAFPDAEAPIEHSTLSALPYLDAFTKELMRMHSPVRGGLRETTAENELKCPVMAGSSGGPRVYTLPKRYGVLVSYFLAAHDPVYYPDPESFEPERFLPGREEDKAAPFTYAPWGGGNRKCLGQPLATLEIKMFLVQLVRDYDVSVDTYVQVDFPLAYVRPTVRLTRRAKN